jgi:hypothetical protein
MTAKMTHRRFRHLPVVIALCAVALVALIVAASFSPTAKSANPTAPAWLSALDQRVATANNGSSPASAEYALTNEGTASSAVGLNSAYVSNPSQAVYLVVLTGSFTDENARVPVGQPAPTGTAITFTADANTQDIQDFGLLKSAPDTAAVGAMNALTLNP